MRLSLIAAVAENGVIGRGGDLPWRLRADLKRFQALTKGHVVIVGRKTHESILRRIGHPLPERTTIVLTRQQDFYRGGWITAHSWVEAMDRVADQDEVFVIGGAEIYRLALPHAQRMYLTQVHARVEGDSFLPEWNRGAWRIVHSEFHDRDEQNEYDSTFEVLERENVRVIIDDVHQAIGHGRRAV